MSSSADYIDHLAQIRLFRSCNDKELKRIAKDTDEVSVSAGKVLMAEGEPGHEAFVVVEGRAKVEIGDKQIAELEPGQHVGELALLDGGARTATVTALTDMKLLVISQRAFRTLLDDVPGLSLKILASLAAQVRELDAHFAEQN